MNDAKSEIEHAKAKATGERLQWPARGENHSLKLEINTLIWMYGPDALTLADADKIACDVLHMILCGKRRQEGQDDG